MRIKTSFPLFLSIITAISALSPTSSYPKVQLADRRHIFASSKIRRIEVPSSLEETEVEKNDFKPSQTFGQILSNNHYRDTASASAFNQNETKTNTTKKENKFFTVKNSTIIRPSVAEILTEPQRFIELFSVNQSNSSNYSTTESTNEINSGDLRDESLERAKGPRIYYGEVQATSNEHSHSHTRHGNPHSASHTGLFFPEPINEVTSTHYEHPHIQSHNNNDHRQYYHAQYDGDYNAVHHGKHVIHEPPVYYSGVRNAHSNLGLSPAVSKALKFWLPTALLITGASVLFPQRIRVPTNVNDSLYNRPKRSAHYLYTTGSSVDDKSNLEINPGLRLPLSLVHSSEDKEIDDYAEAVAPSQYSRHPEFQRRSKPLNYLAATQEPTNFYEPTENLESKKRIPNQMYPIVPRYEPRRIIGAASTIPNDGLKYQKEDSQIRAIDSSDNFNSKIPIKNVKPSSTTKQPTISSGKPNERKVRVILRSRKNNFTSAVSVKPSFTSEGISPVTELNSNNEQNLSTTIRMLTPTPTREVKTYETTNGVPRLITSTSNMEQTGNFASSSSVISKTTAFSTNSPKSAKNPASNSVVGDPDLLQLLNEDIIKTTVATKLPFKVMPNDKYPSYYDLSPHGPVTDLFSSGIQLKDETDACQKRALCELGIRGTNPTATKFETFMWTIATLVPDAFTTFYDLEDTFQAIRDKQCSRFRCANPNLNIQEQ